MGKGGQSQLYAGTQSYETKKLRELRKRSSEFHKMTPHQRQAQFGNECHVVPTTATGSNTVPTRQHPELGQAHRGRMYYRTAQMVTTGQAGRSSTPTR